MLGQSGLAYVFVWGSGSLGWREEVTFPNHVGCSFYYGLNTAIHDDAVVIGLFQYDDLRDKIMTSESTYV